MANFPCILRKRSNKICQYCNTYFIGYNSDYLCNICNEKRERIQNGKINPEIDAVHEKYLMKVRYKVIKKRWINGCCLDYEDSTTTNEITTSEIICKFPTLKNFTNRDINEDGRILDECLESKKMLMYKIDEDMDEMWKETITYQIIDAYVVVNMKIDLG